MATYTSKKAYMYGTGRRKSSVARVHLFPNGTGSITINGRPLDEYFGLETLKLIVRQPFAATDTMGKFDVEATVTGGGVTGQAGAIRHGIARALLQVEDSYRAPLKAAGLLTRDPRMKERKKYGLKAARRASAVQQAIIDCSDYIKSAKSPENQGFPGFLYLNGLIWFDQIWQNESRFHPIFSGPQVVNWPKRGEKEGKWFQSG